MMVYKTILFSEQEGRVTITLNRLSNRNSINSVMLMELNAALDHAEQIPGCRAVIIEGQKGFFCTGMDFTEAVENKHSGEKSPQSEYMEILKRLAGMPMVVIAKIDGQVMAGGVGLAAASDIVVATPASQFSLSEALWGLLPAMVLPYLIRRVGFQKAYSMTLTTMPVSAMDALDMHLADEISEMPDENIKRLCQRVTRLQGATVKRVKEYFRQVWLLNDEMENMAVAEAAKLASDPGVLEAISNYVKYKKFPWENI